MLGFLGCEIYQMLYQGPGEDGGWVGGGTWRVKHSRICAKETHPTVSPPIKF